VSTSADDGDPDETHAIDAAFDEIVANIDQPGTAASTALFLLMIRPPPRSTPPPAEPTEPKPQRTPQNECSEWDDIRIPQAEPDVEAPREDEGHYVPPPPPPLPKGDPVGRWAWAGAVGAPLLAIVLPLVGWGLNGLTGVALVVAFLAGFGTLISRLRPGPRIDDGPDDGAVV
jgi:hypothetical protein